MLQIVGIETNPASGREMVLLQNQGSLSAKLRGHCLATRLRSSDGSEQPFAFLFDDDVLIPCKQHVLLCSGRGKAKWIHSSDGRPIYVVFTGLDELIWAQSNGVVELLKPAQCFTLEKSGVAAGIL